MELDRYVGLPFAERGRSRAGVDCWGLVCLVYREQLAIELPHHADGYVTTADRAALQRLVAEGRSAWREIPRAQATVFDLVELSNAGVPHIGLVAGPGLLLHAEAGADAAVEPLGSLRIDRRIRGFFRHESR